MLSKQLFKLSKSSLSASWQIGMICSILIVVLIKEDSILHNIDAFFDNGAKTTGIRLDSLDYIKKADHLLKLSIPLERDDGTYEIVTAYRSKHKNYRSPTRGGIRLSENCDIQ